jgi:hypothetical protein
MVERRPVKVRIGAPQNMEDPVLDAVHTPISGNWKNMDAQLYRSR